MIAASRRQSGIGVPLFSLVSSRSWGIGEFADLPAHWSCPQCDGRAEQFMVLAER